MKLDLRKTQCVKGITLTPLGNSQILVYDSKTKEAGLHHTEIQIGDAPKLIFPIETHIQIKNQIIEFWRSTAQAAACKQS